MFPADFIWFRAFISSSEAFLHFVGGTSTEAKPQSSPWVEALVLYMKDAGMEITDQHFL